MQTTSRVARSHLVALALLLAPSLVPSTAAAAALSDRSKGIVWNVQNWVYMSKCRFDKPIPDDVDSYFENDCDYAIDQEDRNLKVLTPEERNDPSAKAAIAMHDKSVAFVQKVKAARAALNAKGAALNDVRERFRNDAKSQSSGLWFLQQLDKKQDSYIQTAMTTGEMETKVDDALATKDFAARCVATYDKLDVGPTMNDLLDKPANVCPLAKNREAILKRELPRWLAEMRKAPEQQSADAIKKILAGELIGESTFKCAREPATCTNAGKTAASIAAKVGLPAGDAMQSKNPAFESALKKAAATKRTGKFHDATRERAVVTALKANGRKYIATAVLDSSDDVRKNDFGVPQFKSRLVSVLTKKPDEAFCRVYVTGAQADYEGGGRFGAFVSVGFDDDDDFIVSGCK
jgi:hypothetical protein